MKKKRMMTTFQKLTIGFLLCGMAPLLIFGIIFFVREYRMVQDIMVKNYTQITSYFSKNVEDILDSVDDVLAEMYDYDDGENTLAEVIVDSEMEQSDKNKYIQEMFRDLISKSEYISSERFADNQGNTYSFYYDQNKTLRKGTNFYTTYSGADNSVEKKGTQRTIHAATQEGEFCVNSDDFIFVISRNYMDISNVKTIQTKALGTMYMDINVEQIGKVVEKMQLSDANAYIYLKEEHRYLYSQDQKDYMDGKDPLKTYNKKLKGETGSFFSDDKKLVIYDQIADEGIYAVVVVDNDVAYSMVIQNRAMAAWIIGFILFALVVLYMNFSRWMTSPVVELRKAMEQVETGDLTVRAKNSTNDEMSYIIDGFNKMIENLDTYIKEVYTAQIYQKDAELNALKMQIQPHYLYNTLDVIRMTALDQKDEYTASLLESLAMQLRYVLSPQAERVTLLEEVNMLKEYVVIMQARFPQKFDFYVSLKDEDASLMTLKMLFQPVLGNAIKHGIRPKEGSGRIAMDIARKESYVEVTIMDDGIGMSQEMVEHIDEILRTLPIGEKDPDNKLSVGMKNVYDRIKLSCGQQYGYTVESIEGMGTVVTYHLPIWEKNDEESNNG